MSGKEKSTGKFTVVIYVEEYLQLCSWVLKHEDIETGGDLFGLWADDRTAVIQLVLGPGKNCRRTSVSFYQDVEYLKEVGSYLTGSEGLCHIGEWHSHHQLGLARPSGGDESTVWNNMPTYELDRFVIFIANIDKDRQSFHTNVGCFLFEIDKSNRRRMPVSEGQFIVINESSPMRSKLQTMRNNHGTKEFTTECESLNSGEMLQSLKISREVDTKRLQVSKERVFTQPQYGGTRLGMGKGNAKQKNRNTAPRGGDASGQQRSKTEKEVKKNREGDTMRKSVETPSNANFSMAAPGKMKKEEKFKRSQSGDAKQVSTHKGSGISQQGANRDRNESSSSNKSQGKSKAGYPGHAQPRGKNK